MAERVVWWVMCSLPRKDSQAEVFPIIAGTLAWSSAPDDGHSIAMRGYAAGL